MRVFNPRKKSDDKMLAAIWQTATNENVNFKYHIIILEIAHYL